MAPVSVRTLSSWNLHSTWLSGLGGGGESGDEQSSAAERDPLGRVSVPAAPCPANATYPLWAGPGHTTCSFWREANLGQVRKGRQERVVCSLRDCFMYFSVINWFSAEGKLFIALRSFIPELSLSTSHGACARHCCCRLSEGFSSWPQFYSWILINRFPFLRESAFKDKGLQDCSAELDTGGHQDPTQHVCAEASALLWAWGQLDLHRSLQKH